MIPKTQGNLTTLIVIYGKKKKRKKNTFETLLLSNFKARLKVPDLHFESLRENFDYLYLYEFSKSYSFRNFGRFGFGIRKLENIWIKWRTIKEAHKIINTLNFVNDQTGILSDFDKNSRYSVEIACPQRSHSLVKRKNRADGSNYKVID